MLAMPTPCHGTMLVFCMFRICRSDNLTQALMKRFLRQGRPRPIAPRERDRRRAACYSSVALSSSSYQESDHRGPTPTWIPISRECSMDMLIHSQSSCWLLTSPLPRGPGRSWGCDQISRYVWPRVFWRVTQCFRRMFLRMFAKHEMQALPRLARLDAVSHRVLSMLRVRGNLS